jgi:hypothetical protein
MLRRLFVHRHDRLAAERQVLKIDRRVSAPITTKTFQSVLPGQLELTRLDLVPLSKHSRINKISQRFWMYGIISSLVSSVASLVRLRAEGRRLALSRSISSSSEKGGPEGGDESQRREEGKRLLT